MRRMTDVHPGEDKIVPVGGGGRGGVTAKTQNGILERPAIKLVKLPVSDS